MTYANISKAKKDIELEPKISIDEGISELLKNISYWKNAPLWTKKIKSATKVGLVFKIKNEFTYYRRLRLWGTRLINDLVEKI